MISLNFGIDLGTANTRVFSSRKGLVLDEPTIFAKDINKDKVIAYGRDAYDMLGRTPPSIEAVRPLKDGVISEYNYAKMMLRYYMRKVCFYKIFKPKTIFSVPRTITDIEQRSLVEAALSSGARKVVLMQESLLSAVGAGVDINAPYGNMIVNIGAGSLDIAVLSLNGLVVSNSRRIGGQTMDNEIATHINRKYHLNIGELTAEKIKIKIASATQLESTEIMDVKGYSTITELPSIQTINSTEIFEAIKPTLFQILDAIQETLEMTPPELASDVMNSGILLCGGGAMLRNISKAVETYAGVPCRVADNPDKSVVLGAGKALKYIDQFDSGVYDIGNVSFPLSNLIDL